MPLGKRDLQKLIKQRKDAIERYAQELELLKDKEIYIEKNKDFLKGKNSETIDSYHRIELCSKDLAKIRNEDELALLQEILQKYYQTNKRSPTKLEQAKQKLKQLEKEYKNGSIVKQYEIKDDIEDLREYIEKTERLKELKKEITLNEVI